MTNNQSWKRKAGLYLSSQALSLFGSSLVQYALMWHVTLATKSGFMMTLYVICGFIPTFLLSPFAGVWADRMDRKKLIMLSDGLIAMATLALALVLLSGAEALPLIMVTAAVRALGTAVQGPAAGAFLPQFVPAERLTRVNGLFSSLQSGIMLVSPILSGALMTVWPLYRVFLIDVVTAALAISILAFFLRVPPHAKAAAPQAVSYFADLKLGLRYIRCHPYLVSFFTFVGTLLLLFVPAAFLTPLQVARSFGPEVWRLTALEVVFSVGMMAGGGVVSLWGGFRNRVHTMLMATFGMAVCTVLLGLVPSFWAYLIPMGLFGLIMPFYNTSATVMLQEHIEAEFQGRVFGLFTMLMTSLMPLGMLAFGPLAEAVRIEILLLATGGGMILQGFLVLRNKRLLAAGLPTDERPPLGPCDEGSAAS
jgi:DHA3 family macrolide efflux protein-like MFS transporter